MHKNTMNTLRLVTIVATMGIVVASALPVLAQTAGQNDASTTAPKITARAQRIILRADQEIGRRITAINALMTRLDEVKKISSADKATLTSDLQKQISDLQTLKTKIDGDTNLDTLQADAKSITTSYRIFALVMPRDRIIASADRLSASVDTLFAVGQKLAVRVSDPKYASSSNLTALQTSLNDMQTKLVDAAKQAQDAINIVVALTPDTGDKTKMTANTTALKHAHEKIKTGIADIKAASDDAKKVRKGLDSLKPVRAAATTTTSH